jgi:hypothetical protein
MKAGLSSAMLCLLDAMKGTKTIRNQYILYYIHIGGPVWERYSSSDVNQERRSLSLLVAHTLPGTLG